MTRSAYLLCLQTVGHLGSRYGRGLCPVCFPLILHSFNQSTGVVFLRALSLTSAHLRIRWDSSCNDCTPGGDAKDFKKVPRPVRRPFGGCLCFWNPLRSRHTNVRVCPCSCLRRCPEKTASSSLSCRTPRGSSARPAWSWRRPHR